MSNGLTGEPVSRLLQGVFLSPAAGLAHSVVSVRDGKYTAN